ncbi:DUF6188 family protein [Actinoplanes sp. CA-030573]|uniref:DUF6188 family protein n=1 Tax=Actinoplanes sp. CA-030573 TaxID=3239898 RepID=UPI003D8D2E9B
MRLMLAAVTVDAARAAAGQRRWHVSDTARVVAAMDLGFAGQAVLSTDFGYTVALQFGGGYQVHVEVPLTLRIDGLDREIEPGRNADASAVAQLSGQVVSVARADDSGGLRIQFAGGTRLVATPDSAFEAWTVAGPDGLKVVCGPGGELSVWSPRQS